MGYSDPHVFEIENAILRTHEGDHHELGRHQREGESFPNWTEMLPYFKADAA